MDTQELRVASGTRGGFQCPKCSRLSHFAQPNPVLKFTTSFGLSALILWIVGVRNIFGFVAATLLLWIPLSLLVNAYFVQLLPLRLKPWDPPSPKKGLIETLNEKNAPLELFGKR